MSLDLVTCPDGHGIQQVQRRESVGGNQRVTLACGYVGPYAKASMAPPAAVQAGTDGPTLGVWRGRSGRDK